MFDVARLIVYFPKIGGDRLFLTFDTRMQIVFAFQIAQYLHRTSCFEIMRQFTTLLIDAQRYDMKMLPLDIFMFEDNVGLVAVTHTLHVFLCDFPELFVVQPGDELHFRRVAFDDYELLGEDAFYDKPAAIMLQSCLTKQLIETDIFLFIEPERVLVTRSFRFRSISEGGLSGWYPYMA